jgi:hypothetical protein
MQVDLCADGATPVTFDSTHFAVQLSGGKLPPAFLCEEISLSSGMTNPITVRPGKPVRLVITTSGKFYKTHFYDGFVEHFPGVVPLDEIPDGAYKCAVYYYPGFYGLVQFDYEWRKELKSNARFVDLD